MSILKVNGDGNSILITKFDGSTQLVPKSGIIPPGSTLFNTPDNILSANISAIANISTFALNYTPVPETRTLTINGITYDLSADRSWTLATGLTNWTEAFSSATQATSSLTATNGAANVNAAIRPKGTGAIVAAIPDGTATGGNARGLYATDLQKLRSAADNVASGNYSTISGGIYNIASGENSVVAGGASNTAAGIYNFIGGGFTNSGTANAAITTQSATTTNASTAVTLSGSNSSILLGKYITGTGIASDTYVAAISGTSLTLSKNATASGTNTLSFFNAHGVVVGGGNNQAVGTHSFIGGGGDAGTASERNRVEGQFSAILGGRKNTIKATQYSGAAFYMTIGGGYNNLINDSNPSSGSAILGGTSNTIAGSTNSFIGGGESNYITYGTRWNVIAGGRSNQINGENEPNYRTIGGGYANSGGNVGFTISGGQSNACGAGQYPSIGGGLSNTSSGNYSRVGGGQSNTASGTHSAVVGGATNVASGTQSFVGGGNQNTAGYIADTICGGDQNKLTGTNNSAYRFIGGGVRNTVNAEQSGGSTICGGNGNTIYAGSSGGFIGGGGNAAFPGGNFLCGTNSALVGGVGNQIGGKTNFHTSISSFLGGGENNIINRDADYGVISGGVQNTINTNIDYGIITGGVQGVVSLYGQQVHASGRFAANGDAQAHELIWRRLVTGTTQTELFLDGASIAAILPGTNSVWNGIIDVTAICTVAGDGTTVLGHVEATSFKVTIKRIGTTTSLVGGVQEIGITNADASMSTAVFTIDNNDTNESLRVRFTPPTTAGSTTVIRTIATFRGQQIQY